MNNGWYLVPPMLYMRFVIFSIVLTCSCNLFARSIDFFPEPLPNMSPLEVNQLFDTTNVVELSNLIDYVEQEELVNECVVDYVSKHVKSYSKLVQNNLYDLMHDFDKVLSKVYGKKQLPTSVPHEDKIEAIGRVQCEAYRAMGMLKR